MPFLYSINNNSKKFTNPFDHWELNKPLTEEQINEIINARIMIIPKSIIGLMSVKIKDPNATIVVNDV